MNSSMLRTLNTSVDPVMSPPDDSLKAPENKYDCPVCFAEFGEDKVGEGDRCPNCGEGFVKFCHK